MRIKYPAIFFLLVLVVVCISGCTGSSGSSTNANAGPVSGSSDRDVILRGIASGEQSCIEQLPNGVSADKCRVTTTNKEIIISQILADAKAREQTCLQNLPRSANTNECTVLPATKEAAAAAGAVCIGDVGNNNVNSVRSCVDTAFNGVNS